jgi:hypothetical protein
MRLAGFTNDFGGVQIEEYNKQLEENRSKFENGPISTRSVTDKCCCLIFLVAIVGFVGASYYGWSNGDPRQLLIGWDSNQNGCGFSDATIDYPFLYWPEPPSSKLKQAVEDLDIDAALELLNNGVCVKTCPTADQALPVECKVTT